MLNTDVITIDDSPPPLPPSHSSQLTPVPDDEAEVIIPLTEEGIENIMSSFSRLYNTCTFTNKGLICNKFPFTGLVQHRIRNMILMILMNCIPLVLQAVIRHSYH